MSSPNDPNVVQNNAKRPTGVLPKNAQTWVVISIAVLMALVVMFTPGGTTNAARKTPPVRTPAANPANQQQITEYSNNLALEMERLKLEQQRLQNAKVLTGADRLQAGQGEAANAGNSQAQPDQLALEKKRREYASLFASNVALTYRERGGGPSATTTAPGLSPIQATVASPRPAVPEQPAAAAGVSQPADLRAADGQNYRIFEGTVFETVLTNRLDGMFSGPVNCMVTTNVYSHDHQHLLIPKGSRVLGEADRVQGLDQERLALSFHRIIMPDGYSASLDQFTGMNQIGETGLKDKVNHHYLQLFGITLAIGAIAGLSQMDTNAGFSYDGMDMYRQGFSRSVAQSSLRILDRFLNRLPTIAIREGHRVKVWLTEDLLLPAYENHRLKGNL